MADESSWVGELLSDVTAQSGKAACSKCGRSLPSTALRLKSIDRVCQVCQGIPGLLDKTCDCGAIVRITAKACHSCGRNFHKSGGGGGGGGKGSRPSPTAVGKPVKGGHTVSAAGHTKLDPKGPWTKATGRVHLQPDGANLSFEGGGKDKSSRGTAYIDYRKWKTSNPRRSPPGGFGTYAFQIGQETHMFQGTRNDAFLNAGRHAKNNGLQTAYLLP